MSSRVTLLIGVPVMAASAFWLMAATHDIQGTFSDYRTQSPGVWHRISPADLPEPGATPSADKQAHPIPRPEGAMPKVPAGFTVEQYVSGLEKPRLIRTAPNGDLFIAESDAGKILVVRDGKVNTFAEGLNLPFGINFYPTAKPKYVYIGNTDSVVRFPYQTGDLKASGASETVVSDIPGGGRLRGGGHWTRDIAFSKDGKTMFVSVGSHSNVNDPDTDKDEFHRANILAFTPEGKKQRVYASGIRNPVGITVNPTTGELWCSVNERDALGDNLVPDYITHVREGGFYGWPYYYIGPHQDPRLKGKHPELQSKVIVPDVLLQPHNASLEMVFYEGSQFPAEYKGSAFAAEHGSWNRDYRTGYEVIRVAMQNGKATGEYEDFLTGFVTPSGDVWGRPVGVAVAQDGSLMVTDDVYGAIWRISAAK